MRNTCARISEESAFTRIWISNQEKGFNAELGFKQGYKIGNFQGFVDVAGFYTQYKDMVEFQFGLFNNADYTMINSISDAIRMITVVKVSESEHSFITYRKHKSTGWKYQQTVFITSTRTQSCSIT